MSLVREIMFGLTKIYYLQRIKKKAKSYAGKVYVGGKSFVTANTELGKNVSFNGMGMEGWLLEITSIRVQDARL